MDCDDPSLLESAEPAAVMLSTSINESLCTCLSMFCITKQSVLAGLTPHTFACNLHSKNVAHSNVYTPPAKYLVYSTYLEDFTYVMNKYDIPISPMSFTSGIISLRTSSSSLCYECGGGGGDDRGVALRRQHQTQLAVENKPGQR